MFKKILIANRGEIAIRIMRACRELDVKTVAIFSEVDDKARHVEMADEAVKMEGPPAKAYLDVPQILDLARRAGACAIHPGYGFLSENADFAEACQDKGIVFIGPTADVIRKMGSKVEARRMMESAGIPVVPGTVDPVDNADAIKELGTKYGYPIAIKASAGGGGRGLRVVRREEEIDQALIGAQREGSNYFGDNQVYVEKYLERPRHIEVQILADCSGHVVHLYERDCSSQRRHQKLIEETPAPKLNPLIRERLVEAAVRGAKSIGYTSAGTVECLVFGDQFYFLEVNTRVQVEHPITEFTTGIDIVREQIVIASGEPLSFSQADVLPRGHAIECRINAEDPGKNFMPAPGTITTYREPQMPWVRVDSACYPGYQVLPFYDSLLAKLVVWGRTRQEAIVRTQIALENYEITGVPTTIPFHLLMMADPVFISGEIYTSYVETEMKEKCLKLNALPKTAVKEHIGPAVVATPSNNPVQETPGSRARQFEVDVNERHFKVVVRETNCSSIKDSTGSALPVEQESPSRTRPKNDFRSSNHRGEIRASMHGIVKEIFIKEGDLVNHGQKLLIFEAMKMESEIVSDRAGRVECLKVKPGDTVEAAGVLLVLKD